MAGPPSYPPPPAYPPVYYPPPPGSYGPPPRNGFGVTGLVLGIISLVLPFFVGTICGILAIIFGALGVQRVRHGEATNKRQAVAGLVCGIIGAVVWGTLTILLTSGASLSFG